MQNSKKRCYRNVISWRIQVLTTTDVLEFSKAATKKNNSMAGSPALNARSSPTYLLRMKVENRGVFEC